MSNLTIRILTAFIAGGATVAAIWLSPWGLFAFCILVSVLGVLEFYKITGIKFIPGKVIFVLWILSAWATLLLIQPWSGVSDSRTWISPVFLSFSLWSFPLTAILLLFFPAEKQPAYTLGMLLMGLVWVFFPFALFFFISTLTGENFHGDNWSTAGFRVPLGILLLHWTADSFAYFGGRFWGKHKLFERISPKKTWEGAIAGALSCLLLGLLFDSVWPESWSWVVVAAIVGIISQLGDLVESMLKRSLQIKDSGGLLPGHGGILDRFDGMLVSLPFITSYLMYVMLDRVL